MAVAGKVDKPPSQRISDADLNPEQLYVVRKMLSRYHATIEARTDGKPPPAPLRMIVYGLGGTGKSYVLRAFKQAVDDERAKALASGQSFVPPASDELISVMAPAALAAASVGGITIQRGLNFPRKINNKKFNEGDSGVKPSKDCKHDLETRYKDTMFHFFDEFGKCLFGHMMRVRPNFYARAKLSFHTQL
jgi:hypothetical protein